MQAYLASVGPRVKAPPPGIKLSDDHTTRDSCSPTETGSQRSCNNKVSKFRFVFNGSDAQIQTSHEDTSFPIGVAALTQFDESVPDVQPSYLQADALLLLQAQHIIRQTLSRILSLLSHAPVEAIQEVW